MASGQPPFDPRLGAGPAVNTSTAPLPYAQPSLPPPAPQQQPHHPQHQQQQYAPAAHNLAPPTLNPYPSASPQPYYQYSTPNAQTTPGANSANSQSNQASPINNGPAYHLGNDGGDNSPDHDDNGQHHEDPKRPRACEACRGLKVRCDQDPQHPEIPCRRCQKAGRQCIITAPSRKRQKKADSRVAELEKKLDALTAVLQQQQTGHSQYGSPQSASHPSTTETMQGRASTGSMQPPANPYPQLSPGAAATPQRSSSADHASQPPQKRARLAETESLDGADISNTEHIERYRGQQKSRPEVIDSRWGPTGESMRHLVHRSPEEFMNRVTSLVSPDLGVTIFNRYVTKLAPHMPAVVFPPGTTAEQVWKEKPILYVCILSATSAGTLHADISKQLSREAVRAIGDCVVCNGAKSLELIQAMQVLALWYKPPERAEQTNFYQIIHMAAVMALDIGLGKRFNAAKSRRGFGGPHADYAPGPYMMLPQDSDTIEARRAWLGCYYLCASASMVLRRPNLLRWSNYMKECVDILETSHEAYPSDKLFCQHVKVQHICEDISLQFLMDDNTATISITDPKVTYALNVLENDLKTWVKNIPAECRNNLQLKFFEHVASLYLHEIALHLNHNIDDFRLPFTEESLKTVNNSSETLTAHQMEALDACRKAAHGVLDTMLAIETDTIKVLPMLIFFVRCTYAIVILVKLNVAVLSPGSEISKMMTSEEIRVDYYLERLINRFGHIANEQEFRPHPKILRILSVLREWFRQHSENMAAQARGEQPPHPAKPAKKEQDSSSAQQNQTPLHLLSQVATGNQQGPSQQQQQVQHPSAENRDWSFSTPFPVDYTRPPPAGHPDNQFPVNQQQQQQQQNASFAPTMDNSAALTGLPDQFGMDGLPADYLWGSGFEQAMDLNLGSMDGMDGLLLGGVMPFGFGDATVGGQW